MPEYGFQVQHNGSGEASLLNGLNAAASQQDQLQQRQKAQRDADYQTQLQRDFENTRQLLNSGYVPAQTYPNGPPEPGRPTLMTPEANPAAQGDGQTITAPDGTRMYKPTEREQGKAFVPTGQLGETLKSAFGWDGKTPMTPEHSHSLIQQLNEAQPKDEPYDIDTSGKFRDAKGNPVPVAIGRKTKTVTMLNLGNAGGAPSTGGGAPGGAFDIAGAPGYELKDGQPGGGSSAPTGNGVSFQPAEKPEKAPRTRAVVEGYSSPFLIDEESGETKPVKLPPGVKPSLTPGQQEAGQRFREREEDRADARGQRKEQQDRANFESQSKLHDSLQQKEQEHWTRKQMYADARGAEDNSPVIDPRSGQQVLMNPARRRAYQTQMQQEEKTARQFQVSAKKIRQQNQWGEFAPGEIHQGTGEGDTRTLVGGAPKVADPIGIR